VAEGFEIAEGYLDIHADPATAWRNVQAFLRRVEREMHNTEDDAAESGRRAGRRYGDGLNEGLRGPHGGSLISDLVFGGEGGGGGGEGGAGGGGGFIQGLISGISGGFRRVLDEVRDLIAEIESLLSGLGGGGGFLTDLQDGLNNLLSSIRSGFTRVIGWMHAAWVRSFGSITTSGVGPFFSGLIARARAFWLRFTAWASATFGAMWTRIRTWWSGMSSSLSSFWTRFVTWAIATFGTLRTLGAAFWARMRAWGASTFTTLALVAGILFSRMRAWASGLFSRMRTWFSGVWSRGTAHARSLWTRFMAWGRSAFTAIGGWFSSLFSSISSGASSAWGHLSSAFSSLSSAAGAAGPILQATMFAALIPIILGLGGAVLQLAGALLALPAAIGFLVAAIAPAIVAFKGFGEAVGAGLSGDLEKFNEALKKLTPSAQAVAKEFVKLSPALKDIKKQTQEALFKPLIGTIKPLATTLLPALATGMARAGAALGRLLAGFAKMLATPEVISAVNALFTWTAHILDQLGPPLASLFGALFGTMEGGLPWVGRFFDVLTSGIQKAADWLRQIKSDGSLQRWLSQAWDAGKKFWNLLVAVGELIASIFGSTGDEGLTWIEDLTNMIKKLTDYFKSEEGLEFLDNLVSVLEGSGGLMLTLVDIITALFNAFNGFIDFIKGVPGFFRDLWKSIREGASAIWAWISSVASITWDWIKDAASAVGGFFVSIGQWFVDAYDTVVGWGAALVAWFAKIPGWIGQFFANLPGWIMSALNALRDAIFYGIGWIAGTIVRAILAIPGLVAAAWEWLSTTVSNGVTKWIEAARALPGKIGEALSSLGSTIGNAVDAAWDWAYESTVKGVQYSLTKTGEYLTRAGEILSALPGRVGGWISNAWNKGREATVSGVNSVVDTAKGLPGKIGSALAGAGNWLVGLGADMMRGLIRGITGILGWAVDQAKAAARAVAKGFMDALDSHSPSRLMDREVGRTILPGVVQGIKHDIPDTMRYLGAVANLMVQGFQPVVNVAAPSVNMGSTMLHADFGEGIRQVVPLVITRNPRVVAGSAAVGDRQRSGWVNTGRGRVG
jgi:phage-related protein